MLFLHFIYCLIQKSSFKSQPNIITVCVQGMQPCTPHSFYYILHAAYQTNLVKHLSQCDIILNVDVFSVLLSQIVLRQIP